MARFSIKENRALLAAGRKWCPDCTSVLPVEEFSVAPSRSNGLTGRCRACAKRYNRRYYSANADRIRENQRRWDDRDRASGGARRKRLARYGISESSFSELLRQQDGRCALCGTTEPGAPNWHIDHDHACCQARGRACVSCVRGLLCAICNVHLGAVEKAVREGNASLRGGYAGYVSSPPWRRLVESVSIGSALLGRAA